MPRSPLLSALRRSMWLAELAGRRGMPPIDELVEIARDQTLTRRRFLRDTSATLAGAAAATIIPGCLRPRSGRARRSDPRIVIVGAGVAGLNAAQKLRQAGMRATVYEAAGRSGGRMFSATDLLGPGLTTELGGEFLDSDHGDMFALAREFGLDLLDMNDDAGSGLVENAYFFDGRHHSEREIVEAFVPIAAKMRADFDRLGETIDYRDDGGAGELDRLSIAGYLERVGATGLVRELLEIAYVTEYGLDVQEQSALNLLLLIGLEVGGGFKALGESDERYKIRGGNQRITDELAARLDGAIELGHRLTAVRARGDGFTLTLDRKGGGAAEVNADIVVVTVPFSVLRDVEMNVELPPVKRRAIGELGYGNNAKVLVGFARPVWRDKGYSGNILTDEAVQLAWDNSRMQGTQQAGLTLYSGGEAALRVGEGTAAEQAARLLPGIEAAFPGLSAGRNGRVERFHWPSHPYSRGSYACYRPGQWTTIRGAEFEPVGNLFFAGEHCSADFQGFMNGAAETGRRAATAIMELVRA